MELVSTKSAGPFCDGDHSQPKKEAARRWAACPALPGIYAIQKGLFISRCASHRVIPMSRKVASIGHKAEQ